MRIRGSHVTRILAALLMPILLAACVTAPNGNYSDEPCTPSGNVYLGADPLADLAFTLIVDVTWFAGCETFVTVANGVRDLQRAQAHHGVYVSPDRLFSVNVPDDNRDIQIREQTNFAKDSAYFVSSIPGRPVYAISVIPNLSERYASLSIEQFASQAAQGLSEHAVGNQGQLAGLRRVYQEALNINDKPALFEVYRRDAQANAGQPDYYLMYFIRNGSRAAILTVTWSSDCPKCAKGPEAAIRDMDPGIGKFVNSFRLADPGKTL